MPVIVFDIMRFTGLSFREIMDVPFVTFNAMIEWKNKAQQDEGQSFQEEIAKMVLKRGR